MHPLQNAAAVGTDTAVQTLNQRLNKISESLQYQCERVESVLSRVHGNPTPQPPKGSVAQIAPTLSLAVVVEHLEAVQARLADLCTSMERIA